jgi:hypothetical protein
MRIAGHLATPAVNYTEPLFVVVIMALASTRPVIGFAESALRRVAAAGGATPAAGWTVILTIGPVLGSFITEPAAMTICALLLARQFFDLQPSTRLKYATLGVLFVNVSIGGTLTQFAAPPVLMVARPWGWDIPFMVANFGWRAITAIVVSTAVYFILFRKELRSLAARAPVPEVERPDDDSTGAQEEQKAAKGQRWIVRVDDGPRHEREVYRHDPWRHGQQRGRQLIPRNGSMLSAGQ